MILSGTLHAVPDIADDRPQWRAGAARDADAAATTQAQFVDATRRAAVREALAILRGAHRLRNYPAADRQADVARILAESVEKQARVSGLGRITIPVGRTA
jgi:hypothetical protein